MPLTALGRFALVLPFAGFLLVGPAAAVDSLEDLDREIARTERELEVLRQGVFQLAQFTPAEAGNLERRFAAIEDEMRRLTGQVERLSYVQRQLADRMDRFQSDVEYRLNALEGGNPAQPSTSSPATTQSGSGDGSPQVIGTVSAEELAQIQGGGQNQTASTSQTGGFAGSTDTTITGQGGLPAYDNQQAAVSGDALPAGTPQEQYNYAFGLLRQADYSSAERALLAFIQQNPNDPLVANAKYWLGETYYVRGDYQAASQAFAQSYQEHDNGPKAPDSLLKLGLSLSLMGQTGQACQVLQELDARLGNSAKANILERARRERANLGC